MSASNMKGRKQWDSLWINVHIATMVEGEKNCGSVNDAAIAVVGEKIAWVGLQKDLLDDANSYADQVIDGNSQWLTPGLIDCHTHLVFGGNRAKEFEQRLQGVSYEEIARSGGGIRSTVTATRLASEDDLVKSAGGRLEKLLAEGVTSVEIKSGYGLTTETELTMLRAAKRLQDIYPVNISTTFLGAHALPEEYEGRRAEYVSLVCEEMLPLVAEEGLADAVDVFCETIGFSVEETEVVLETARKYGLKTKIHADQLADSGGAKLAAKYHSLSADHIEYTSSDSVRAMADNGTVAVILPGAFYFLREIKLPPIDLLREHKVAMAIATDANPGSSPTTSLLLMMNMACTFFRMTPEEVLAGVTLNAARALGISDQVGSLEVGKNADFALWNIKDLPELCYWIGVNNCSSVVKDGQIIKRG